MMTEINTCSYCECVLMNGVWVKYYPRFPLSKKLRNDQPCKPCLKKAIEVLNNL